MDGDSDPLQLPLRDAAAPLCSPATDHNQYLPLTPHAKTACDEFGASHPTSPALQVRASNLLKVRATNVLFPKEDVKRMNAAVDITNCDESLEMFADCPGPDCWRT